VAAPGGPDLRSPATVVAEPARAAGDAGAAAALAALVEMLSSVLYLTPGDLDPATPFQEQGVDSVLGVEFIGKVNERFGSSLKATALYDFPTIGALAAHVAAGSNGPPPRPRSRRPRPRPRPRRRPRSRRRRRRPRSARPAGTPPLRRCSPRCGTA
jgi:acyl carrier protein